MAELRATGGTITVSLSTVEKIATLRSGFRIPRSAVSSAGSIQTPFKTVRGIRSPGILIPSKIAAGTWRHRDGKDLLLLHARHSQAVVLELTGQEFLHVVVSDNDPQRTLERLRLPRNGVV